ncbi:DinB family protein [Streptomonospora wellingtoniae]|uniref:DinB family protein n=1 Tax=Streptomonospora wellingtoniae TaxID=3075544 RepID=A0ABU2KPB2_9ACTN|nr:DinB family protein [Streptomonospora sp. DSM 45055]MDT0301112.1 DinB family protein [Streptomonospora sp. DSM 45055]
MTAPEWGAEILGQLESHWARTMWPRLQGLDDDEYFWEPVEGCWSVRPRPDGGFGLDFARPEPDPPPVTTIAWRLSHVIVVVLEARIDRHFGGSAVPPEEPVWPGGADHALDRLERAHRRWRDEVRKLSGADFAAPVGAAEPAEWSQRPFAALALHVNREVIHHHAEIALLRDLYRSHPAHRDDAL